jgi:hypothetical protein
MKRTKNNRKSTPKEEETFNSIDRWWERKAKGTEVRNSPYGPKPINHFATPDDLWKAACEYFEWVTERPQYEARPFQYKGMVILSEVPKLRPFTIKGLLIFLDISIHYWDRYRTREGAEFASVCEKIEMVIYQQKFEGASVDLFNASIIARDLGLRDSTELTGPNGGPIQQYTINENKIPIEKLSDEQLDTIITALDLRKGNSQ